MKVLKSALTLTLSPRRGDIIGRVGVILGILVGVLFGNLNQARAGVATWIAKGTNGTVNGNSITFSIGSKTVIFTNATTATTVLANTTGAGSMTNLINQMATYQTLYLGITATMTNTNTVVIRGENLLVSQTGNWCSLVGNTNNGPGLKDYVWPVANITDPAARTNQVSDVITSINSGYPSNVLSTTAAAWTNFLNKGSGSQSVTGITHFVYGLKGTNLGLTNGPIVGSAITSATFDGGSIGLTTDVELGKTVIDDNTADRLAFKGPSGTTNGVIKATDSGPALFDVLGSSTPLDMRVPDDPGVLLNFWSAIRIFPNLASGLWIGTNIWNIRNDWFGTLNVFHDQLGASNFWATGFRQTNGVFYGTNIMAGRLQYPRAANSTLVNGNNANILLGTNYFITLSGPTTISEIAGFAAEPDGTMHLIQFRGAATNWLVNYTGSSRATDAIAVNRIETGEPGNADVLMTNTVSWLLTIYDGSVSRWQVISHSK